MPGENSLDITTEKESSAVKSLRRVRGANAITGGTRDFLHFLLDYNIVSFTISFVIAHASYKAISQITTYVTSRLTRFLRVGCNSLAESIVTLFLVLAVCFVFIQFVFKPLISNKHLSEERHLKELVKAAEEKKLEKRADEATSQMNRQLSFLDPTHNQLF
jgi:large-conductance mechanosensitive channel